jgi:hypothetical protein
VTFDVFLGSHIDSMVMNNFDFLHFLDDYCGLSALASSGCRFEGG